MIKILISAKYLAKKLNDIDFETEYVTEVALGSKQNLIIKTTKKILDIPVEVLEFSAFGLRQENRRWDWVKKLVSQVDEQPIVLQITEGMAEIKFQY